MLHCASVNTWHGTIVSTPGSMQHAPVAGGLHSGLGVVFPHEDPTPCHTPPAVARHCASLVIRHGTNGAPDAVRQHAPIGAVFAHELVAHTVPAPSHCPAHAACVVVVHTGTPLGFGAQHPPVSVCPIAVPAPNIATTQHSAATHPRFIVRRSMERLLDRLVGLRLARPPGTGAAHRGRHRQGTLTIPIILHQLGPSGH